MSHCVLLLWACVGVGAGWLSRRKFRLLLVLVAPAAVVLAASCSAVDGFQQCRYEGETNCAQYGYVRVPTSSFNIGDAGSVSIDPDGGCSTSPGAGACVLCAEAECCEALIACATDAGTSCPALDDCLRASCTSFCPEAP